MDLADAELPTTRNLHAVLEHYVNHLLLQASRLQHTEAHRLLGNLKAEHLKPLGKRATKAREAADTRNRELAAEKLALLPPLQLLKAGIHKSMVDLHWATELSKQSEHPIPNLKGTGNCIGLGLTNCNSYAGRPGGWPILPRSEVEEMLATETPYIIIKKHKTSPKHGSASRPVPPGNRQAYKKLLEIHRPGAAYFFDPAKPTTNLQGGCCGNCG